MSIQEYFPIWNQLTAGQQRLLSGNAVHRTVSQGTVLHRGEADCVGLLLIEAGRLRAYILSEEGREITLYRLFDRDICLFSAACMLNSIQFEVFVKAEQDTSLWQISPGAYQQVMKESAPLANYTNELMASRFTDVMWLMDQVLYKRMDARLAAFLVEESRLTSSRDLRITHEAIANHLGSAREVVSRMLKYLQSEGMVTLSRGGVALTDPRRLERLAGDSLR